jgi:hypothetical protein
MVSAKEGKLFETNSKISAEESKLFEMNSKISAEESKPFDLKSTIPITDGFNGIGMGGGEGKISCAGKYDHPFCACDMLSLLCSLLLVLLSLLLSHPLCGPIGRSQGPLRGRG